MIAFSATSITFACSLRQQATATALSFLVGAAFPSQASTQVRPVGCPTASRTKCVGASVGCLAAQPAAVATYVWTSTTVGASWVASSNW